jgi:uncharacterized membrane protein YphA (DoxX/SURF4 family)
MLEDWDAIAEIRRRRKIMLGRAEGKPGATNVEPGAPPPPPLGPGLPMEFVGVRTIKGLFTHALGVPRGSAFVFFSVRILAGLIWLVNGIVKNPWNDWGYFPRWTQKFADHSPIPPYKWFLENVVIPNMDFWGWIQFLLEVGLGILLLAGLFTGLAAFVSIGWALNIFVGSVFVPEEWVWGLLSFLAVMVIAWVTRAGRYLGMDAFLRTELLTHKHALVRWIARWTM